MHKSAVENFQLNEFQEEFNDLFTKVIHGFPSDLLNYVKSRILIKDSFFKGGSFNLEIVVDTNILFSEVRSYMINGQSFFMKLLENPNLKFYSTSQLRYELHEKIKIKFPKDKKTKQIDINESLIQAEKVLSKIEIRDDISKKALKKAEEIIQKRDKDDVSFLALNLTLKSHGILTKDKDFIDQEEIKTWELKNVGQVVTELNNGILSFYILNSTLPVLMEAIVTLLSMIWHNIMVKIFEVIASAVSMLAKGVKTLSKLPKELTIVIGIATILALLNDSFREEAKEFLKEAWDKMKEFIKEVKNVFAEIWKTMKEILELLSPIFKDATHLLEYFMYQSGNMTLKLEELEKSRPN